MPPPNELIVRDMYDAINRGDMRAVVAAFAPDAVWHGGDSSITGAEAIGQLVGMMRELSGGTLHIELHDVVASEDHVVALQVTTASRGGKSLADRVVYVFHLRDGRITEAWFSGDPRIQDEFWS
jgi:uncharacterized protein